jgi:hypothetical protein
VRRSVGGEEEGEAAAEEAEEVDEEVDAQDEESGDDGGGEKRMGGGEPGEPDGENVFAEAEGPVGEGFGAGIDGGAGGGFRAVGGEGDASGEKSGGPVPVRSGGAESAEGEQSGGGRADESVHGIPEGVEPGNFVGEEFDKIESDGNGENGGIREDTQGCGEVDHPKALEETEGGDGGVEIESGGEAGAEDQAESFEGIHGGIVRETGRRRKYHILTRCNHGRLRSFAHLRFRESGGLHRSPDTGPHRMGSG